MKPFEETPSSDAGFWRNHQLVIAERLTKKIDGGEVPSPTLTGVYHASERLARHAEAAA